MNLKDLIFGTAGSAAETGASPDRKTALAAVLIEMAAADNEFDPAEEELILGILQQKFSLTAEQARLLTEHAAAAREKSIDLYTFTREINTACSREEKLEMMEMLWEIVYSDGRLDGHEDSLIHRLTRMLNLDHKDMIDAKLRAAAKNTD